VGREKVVGGWIQCKKCVHMYLNTKMIAVETVPGILGGGDKGEQWRRWIQGWYIWYIVRTFVNATMYPHPAQQ
jgi:hypothetical protein